MTLTKPQSLPMLDANASHEQAPDNTTVLGCALRGHLALTSIGESLCNCSIGLHTHVFRTRSRIHLTMQASHTSLLPWTGEF